MYIVSKDKKSIINTEQVTSLYIGADGCTIKADFGNGKGCQIGRYHSEKECQVAIGIIATSLGKSAVCYMPDSAAITARLSTGESKQHHISGKKAKGHGGS